MDSRKIIEFFKSPTGKGLAFLLVVLILSFFFSTKKKPLSKRSISLPNRAKATKLIGDVVDFDGATLKKEIIIPPLNPKHQQVKKDTTPKTTSRLTQKRLPQPVIPPPQRIITSIGLYSNRSKKDYVSSLYAPYGRLIKCELVNTIDTSNLTSPIIALVTEDLEHNGKVIIPANTEIHGFAAKSAMRDRVGTATKWKFVWRTLGKNNGKELDVKGTALADTKSPSGEYWAIDDGSAGIPGVIIDNRDEELIKALAAIAIKGAGKGLKNEVTTVLNNNATSTSYESTVDAIMGNILEESGEFLAKQILDSINKQGYYVHCRAGTTFYLYVMQSIDLKEATVAGKKK